MSDDALSWLMCGPSAIAGLWLGLRLAYSQTVAAHINRAVDSVRAAAQIGSELRKAASGCSHTARSDGQNGGEQGATPPAPAAPAAEGGAS